MIIVAKKNDDFKEKLSTLYISQKGGWSFLAAGQAGIELGQIKPAQSAGGEDGTALPVHCRGKADRWNSFYQWAHLL